MPIRDLAEWNLEACRLTLFPAVGQQFDPQAAFEVVAGMPPEEMRTQREAGQTMLRATIDAGNLQLIKQPDRIHLVLSASGERRADDALLQGLGPYPDRLAAFLEIAGRWLGGETTPETVRIAFGAVLASPVESKEAGYELLGRYVPSLDTDPRRVSDLVYRINRLRFLNEGAGGPKINRIATWAVVTSISAEIQISELGLRRIGGEQAFALRLELDISTDEADQEPLARDSQYAILRHLADAGSEIAAEGDIP